MCSAKAGLTAPSGLIDPGQMQLARTTPAPGGKDVGIVQQLFRNLGQKQIFGN